MPAAAVTVRVAVVDPPEGGVTEPGLMPHDTPAGQALTDRAIRSLKPFKDVAVMVDVPELPPAIGFSDVGFADNEKSGAMTVTATVVV